MQVASRESMPCLGLVSSQHLVKLACRDWVDMRTVSSHCAILCLDQVRSRCSAASAIVPVVPISLMCTGVPG